MAPGAAGRTASSAWAGRGQCGSGVSTVHAGLTVTLAELALSLPGDSRAPRRPALSLGQWHRALHLPGPVLHPGDANCLRPPGSSGQLWQPVPLRTLRTVGGILSPTRACTPRALGSMEWGGPLLPRPGGGLIWARLGLTLGKERARGLLAVRGHRRPSVQLWRPGASRGGVRAGQGVVCGPVGVGCKSVRG